MRCWLPWALAGALASTVSAETDRATTALRVSLDTPIVVRATGGQISIVGWSRPDVEVEIVRHGPTAEALSRLVAHVEASDEQLLVSAIQADGQRDPRLTSSITVRVPRHQRLGDVELVEGAVSLTSLRRGTRVRVARGSISADSVEGVIRLETEIGNIRVSRAALTNDGMIRLRTFNGDVSLAFVSTPPNARILALSLGGTIESSIPLTTKAQFGPRFAETVLGRGGPVVSIDVVKGRIRITSGQS